MPDRRTLQLIMTMRDFASRQFLRAARIIAGAVRFTLLAPFRVLIATLRIVRTLLFSLVPVALAFFGILRGGQSFVAVVEGVDELGKLAQALGAPIEQVAELQKAMEFAGIEGERFRAIMLGLQRGIAQATRGTGEQLAAFTQMGISIRELRELTPGELFERMSVALQAFDSEAEKASVLQRIFPDNFQRMLVLLGQGPEAFRQNVLTAREFGASLGLEAAPAATKFVDALTRLKTVLASVGREVVLQLAQDAIPFLEGAAQFIRDNREVFVAGLKAIIELLARLAFAIGSLVANALAFLVTRGGELIELLDGIPLVGDRVADSLREMFNVDKVRPEARALRDELRQVADEIAELERLVDKGATGGGGERSPAQQLQAARQRLEQLAAQFLRAQFPGEGRPGQIPGLIQQQLQAARARQFADILDALRNLGVEGTEGGSIFRALEGLFGEGGGEGGAALGGQGLGDFIRGLGDGIKTAADEWLNFQRAGLDAGRSIVDTGLGGLVDGLADVITQTKSAKQAFRDWGRDTLTVLARIISRLFVMHLLQGAISGLGGLFSSGAPGGVQPFPAGIGSTNFPGFQHGTRRVDRPQLAVVGEVPEAIIPLTGRGSVPVEFLGGAGARGPVTVSFTIQALDASGVDDVLARRMPEIIDAVRNAVETNENGLQGTLREFIGRR